MMYVSDDFLSVENVIPLNDESMLSDGSPFVQLVRTSTVMEVKSRVKRRISVYRQYLKKP